MVAGNPAELAFLRLLTTTALLEPRVFPTVSAADFKRRISQPDTRRTDATLRDHVPPTASAGACLPDMLQVADA